MRGQTINTGDALRSKKDGVTWLDSNGDKIAHRSKIQLVGVAYADDPDTRVITFGDAATDRLRLAGDPIDDLDAVTKQYVDSLRTGAPGALEWAGLRLQRIGGYMAPSGGSSTLTGFGCLSDFTSDGTTNSAIFADAGSSAPGSYNSGEGAFIGKSTTTATGSVAGFRSAGVITRRRYLPKLRFIIRNGNNAVDNCRIWLGFFSTLPTTTDDPTGHVAGFRWSTASGGAGDTTVRVLTKDGTTLRNVDSGHTFDQLKITKFSIDMSTAGEIHYAINDSEVDVALASSGHPLPEIDTSLHLCLRIVNGNSGEAVTLRLGSLMFNDF